MTASVRLLLFGLLAAHPFAHAQEPKPVLELEAAADFLALHVTGTAPPAATTVQYRLAASGEVPDEAGWTQAKVRPAADGAFAFDITLPESRWSELQVRALRDGEELARRETHAKAAAFRMLTPERIAALPEGQRASWTAYIQRSQGRFANEHAVLAAECRRLGLAKSNPAPQGDTALEIDSDTRPEWFAGSDTRALTDAVISYQTPTGGWSKSVDYTKGPRRPGTHWTSHSAGAWHYCGTIDNRSTTEQIKLLAGVFSATGRDDAKAAALRGIEYLFEAQFPNGGWPQNYPVEPGYHEAITLNDNAMTHVLEVLLSIGQASPPFTFADAALRRRALASLDAAITCLAAAQLHMEGRPAVWCAQHDPLSFAPVAARLKEPPSLSGSESAELLRFLMRKAPVSQRTTAMIEPALRWLDAHRITHLRKTKDAAGRTDYVPDAASPETYWARFYDVQTGQPIFPGAQDGILHPTYHDMAAHNKVAYDFLTTKPGDLFEKELPRWKRRLEKTR